MSVVYNSDGTVHIAMGRAMAREFIQDEKDISGLENTWPRLGQVKYCGWAMESSLCSPFGLRLGN